MIAPPGGKLQSLNFGGPIQMIEFCVKVPQKKANLSLEKQDEEITTASDFEQKSGEKFPLPIDSIKEDFWILISKLRTWYQRIGSIIEQFSTNCTMKGENKWNRDFKE